MNIQEKKYIPSAKVITDGMLGEAIGDALGVPVEFKEREYFKTNPVTKMLEFGTWHQPAGTWSDDSAMTLAAMASIVDQKKVDWQNIMEYFEKWLNDDYFVASKERFDCGNTVVNAIGNWQRGALPIESGPTAEKNSGNGSLMRIYPFAMYYADGLLRQNKEAVQNVANASRLTHGSEICQQCCIIYSSLLAFAAYQKDNNSELDRKELLFEGLRLGITNVKLIFDGLNHYLSFLNGQNGVWEMADVEKIMNLNENSIEELPSAGFVFDSFQAALWCFLNTSNYNECVLKAVNLGKDTDTTAAIAGMLAGIYYSEEGISKEWVDTTKRTEDIRKTCNEFYTVIAETADMTNVSREYLRLWMQIDKRNSPAGAANTNSNNFFQQIKNKFR